MFDLGDVKDLSDCDSDFPGTADVNRVISEIIEYARMKIVDESMHQSSGFTKIHPAVMLTLLASNLASHFLHAIIISPVASCRLEQVKSITSFIKQ
jgi:hypothetical protein